MSISQKKILNAMSTLVKAGELPIERYEAKLKQFEQEKLQKKIDVQVNKLKTQIKPKSSQSAEKNNVDIDEFMQNIEQDSDRSKKK